MFSSFPTNPRSFTIPSTFPLALCLLRFRKQTGKQMNKQKFSNKLQQNRRKHKNHTHAHIHTQSTETQNQKC